MRVAIYGYGNLGKGVESALQSAPDMDLVGVYTRRDPATVETLGAPVFSAEELKQPKGKKIDVLILCGGSATDLPAMTPELVKHYNVIDSFDTHAKIPEHFDAVNQAAVFSGHIALISAGWDPGMFSLNRLYANAILPNATDYTFWGKGVSQGHSDAIRRIDGVVDARQYTVPVEDAMEQVREGKNPQLTTRQKHLRECYVVAEEGANKEAIETAIKTMPNYFADYDTTVHFISQEELDRDHAGLPHGGSVICTGTTGKDNQHKQVIEYKLTLDSNPEFTASVIVAYARALYKMRKRHVTGCKTVFDITPADLSPLSPEELRAKFL